MSNIQLSWLRINEKIHEGTAIFHNDEQALILQVTFRTKPHLPLQVYFQNNSNQVYRKFYQYKTSMQNVQVDYDYQPTIPDYNRHRRDITDSPLNFVTLGDA